MEGGARRSIAHGLCVSATYALVLARHEDLLQRHQLLRLAAARLEHGAARREEERRGEGWQVRWMERQSVKLLSGGQTRLGKSAAIGVDARHKKVGEIEGEEREASIWVKECVRLGEETWRPRSRKWCGQAG